MTRDSVVAVSPWNEHGIAVDVVRARPPRIADCTLRDGEQQPGLAFSAQEKVAIATMLAGVGVHDLELGTPAVSTEDALAIEQIVALGLGVQTSALAAPSPKAVDLVHSLGVDAVRLSMPIGDRQREAKTHVSAADYVGRAVEISHYAKQLGLQVIFSPFDTTRCDRELLEALLQAFADEQCVDRVRLVDTTGAASPEAIAFLVRVMKSAGQDIAIEVHCHDDVGLATANTVAGAIAGADYLSVTTNGLGERSGNAALEEVVTALYVLYGVDTGIRLGELVPLSRLVEQLSRVELQPHKPVVGRNSFAHESGMVVAGVLRDPFTAEAYPPELVGQTRRIVVGKKSGRASVQAKLAELFADSAREVEVEHLVGAVKARALELGRALDDDEFRELVR
jgi:isopropylmalate/homocitrate/citramalate synthase